MTDLDERPWIRILGSRGLSAELVRTVLMGAGIGLLQEGATYVAGGVTVLVQPRSCHWLEATQVSDPIVLVTEDQPNDSYVVDAVLRGADAVVPPESPPAAIVDAVAVVAGGGSALSPSQVRAVAQRARAAAGQKRSSLTQREAQILSSITQGQSVKQTARSLGIATKTVENLQSRLFRKLGVRNRAQAVARAHDLVGDDPQPITG